MLVDTHCHLDFNSFDPDRQHVLARAREAGVERILNPGIELASSRAVVELAQSQPGVFAAVGVHPNEALTWQAESACQLRELASLPEVVAIGEIGLDYYRDRAPRELQRRIFQEQLSLAADLRLPVIIHNRDATEEVLEILAGWQAELQAAGSSLDGGLGVLHSYSGDEAAARRAIDHNFLIGFTGPITFRNATDLQVVAQKLPLEHILVETDAPFLSPHPHRGKRNEPAFVRFVVEKIAELKDMSFDSVAEVTAANAARLFNW